MTVRQYGQYREYQMAFWEWITEVVYGADMTPMDTRRYARQVSLALARISPATVHERRG